jgi:hypothetical protein
MKILNIEYNLYGRQFITASMDGKESFNGTCFRSGYDYHYSTKDKAGRTHCIEVRREKANCSNPYKTEYKNTYCVGCGSGANMGWNLGLTLRQAIAIARAKMSICESFNLVAGAYIDNA